MHTAPDYFTLTKAKWIDYNPNCTYPLKIYFPNVDFHVKEDKSSLKVYVYDKYRLSNKASLQHYALK